VENSLLFFKLSCLKYIAAYYGTANPNSTQCALDTIHGYDTLIQDPYHLDLHLPPSSPDRAFFLLSRHSLNAIRSSPDKKRAMSASTPRITSEPPIVVADSQIPSSFAAAINHNRQQHHPNQIHANPGHPAPLRQESGHPDGDFDMAVDEDHRTSSSPGRSTIAYCKSCGAEFGEFYNSWSKVTGSYYLPCMVGSYRCTGLRPKSKPKAASPESALVEW
jgi:hypothetical protein